MTVLPESLHKTNEPKTAQIRLEYQNNIMELPIPPAQLYAQSCASDTQTMSHWRETWIRNIRENKKRFGAFRDHSAGQLFKTFEHKPCIIAGAGPSLKDNAKDLLHRGSIPLVSCLHNFHFLEDIGANPEFYVSLDSGDITIEEVSEGGTKSAEEYWAKTKDRSLIAYIGTSPKLFEKWQGKIYLFNAPLPDAELMREIDEIERFGCYVSNGGNVLGACLYLARGFFGCCPIAFVGADFSFSYEHKFHGWDSKYDKNLGNVIKMVDVFGNKRLSWQSYANFKGWFDQLSVTSPQIFINCSEGGCFGSYPEGNVVSIKQMKLARFLFMYRMHEELIDQMTTPEISERRILF